MINISCLTSVSVSSFLDRHSGYIHNLSPIKRTRNQNQWYNFYFQTSPSKLRRVVGFNIATHSMLQGHEASKTAVTLKNTKQNSNNDIIFNQQSTLNSKGNTNLWYWFWLPNHQQIPKDWALNSACKEDYAWGAPILQVNQKVNVTASISLGNENSETDLQRK